MRGWLRCCTLFACMFVVSAGSVAAQDKDKAEKNEPAAVPTKYERDGTTMLVHYLIATIASILMMVLICMPIRRE